VGDGTPDGNVFRRYWLPVLLSSELPEADGGPVRMRLLGEDLIAFRDTSGAVGLLRLTAPIACAPSSWAAMRNPACAASYHGWKYDPAASASKCRPSHATAR